MENKEPIYSFADESTELSPINRKIAKTMEVTETFTVFEAMSYLAKIDKAIKDKQAEIDGLMSMKNAYITELTLIEVKLGVQGLEEEYQKQIAEENEVESNKEVVEGVEEVDGSIESPYGTEDTEGNK